MAAMNSKCGNYVWNEHHDTPQQAFKEECDEIRHKSILKLGGLSCWSWRRVCPFLRPLWARRAPVLWGQPLQAAEMKSACKAHGLCS